MSPTISTTLCTQRSLATDDREADEIKLWLERLQHSSKIEKERQIELRQGPKILADRMRPHLPSFFSSSKIHDVASDAAGQLKVPNARTEMSGAFVSKSRRVRFELTLRIIDLNNVPLVSGTSLVKWHLPGSNGAEHRGRTSKCPIRDHRVAYDYEKRITVRLTVGRDGILQECNVNFEIMQEYNAGGRGERITLGELKLNLAEYVEASELQSPTSPGPNEHSSDEGVVRRYLMQESKINSTLKVGIHMRHVDGTREYDAPSLRTAPVFGGIAGIMSSSEPVSGPAHLDTGADGQDTNVPNLSSASKENGEMQDMYRRTLAAFWTSQPGELKADEAIEDIFSGGNGWGKSGRPEVMDTRQPNGAHDNSSRPGSGSATPNPEHDPPVAARPRSSHSARAAIGMSTGRHKHSKHHRQPKGKGEIDEFDVCEDLKSWRIGERAYT